MKNNRHPYEISSRILELIAAISEKTGEINAVHLSKPPTELRKKNRIKTIQSSLEIEGNTLITEQITALFENKRVLAPPKDILEVKNAIAVYDKLNKLDAYSLKSLYKAHEVLMKGLIASPGKLRRRSVGIVKGDKVAHLAPSGDLVKPLLVQLFRYLKNDNELLLIKSCVFHYEFEFIHPFTDGNGRMGRLWQTLILKEKYPVFEYLPIESLIKERQQQYYSALSRSDKSGHSTPFIEFMLEVMNDTLELVLRSQNIALSAKNRVAIFIEQTEYYQFTRQDYLRHFKEISTATASRDLKLAVDLRLIKKSGDKRLAKYRVVKKKNH